MSGLLVEHSYEPIAVDKMEAVKDEVENLPPGINRWHSAGEVPLAVVLKINRQKGEDNMILVVAGAGNDAEGVEVPSIWVSGGTVVDYCIFALRASSNSSGWM